MTIYLDVIWFLNFCIDFLLLWLTAVILKRHITLGKLFTGAFVGSLYVLFLFMNTDLVYHPVVKFIYSVIIIFITFGYKRFTYFVKGLFMFYFSTFITGGGILGAHYFLQTEAQFTDNVLTTRSTGMGDPISWLFVVLMIPFMIYFTKRRIGDVVVRKLKYDQVLKFELKIGSITLHGHGLLDSGNQLHDPISKSPVLILDVAEFRDQLPEEVVKHTDYMDAIGQMDNDTNPWMTGCESSSSCRRQLQSIPHGC